MVTRPTNSSALVEHPLIAPHVGSHQTDGRTRCVDREHPSDHGLHELNDRDWYWLIDAINYGGTVGSLLSHIPIPWITLGCNLLAMAAWNVEAGP